MPIIQVNINHDQVTTRSGHRYIFTEKHHGGPNSKGQAQWLPSLAFEDEFWVFNMADEFIFCDDDGTLYGLLKRPGTLAAFIGTRDEQIATFPAPNAGSPWHGYPVYPLAGIKGRSGEFGRPKNAIFARMAEVGLLTTQEVTRLKKRKHI
jgi:hypothetical protein